MVDELIDVCITLSNNEVASLVEALRLAVASEKLALNNYAMLLPDPAREDYSRKRLENINTYIMLEKEIGMQLKTAELNLGETYGPI